MTPLHADRILRQARLLEPAAPPGRPGALALHRGVIVAAGGEAEMDSLVGPDTVVESLGGRTVLPGLVDSHIHLERYARHLSQVDCATPDLEACLARLKAAAHKSPPGSWLLGHGWDQNIWGQWPTAQALDGAGPDQPIYLTAHSLHAAAANSAALAIARVDAATPDPPGGHIQRDDKGRPTGVLLESAMQLVSQHLPEPTTRSTAESIRRAQRRLLALGVTAVHDFDGARCLSALQVLRDQRRLRLRVLKNLQAPQLEAALQVGLRAGLGDEWLRIGNIKVFTDGALGPRTAAMLSPYDDDPGSDGLLLLEADAVFEIARRALAGGFGMTIHAIGDRANRTALSALARLAQEAPNRQPPLPHRIEHVQLLEAEDLPRLAQLGVVASMQPIHAISDRAMAELAWGTRVGLSYAWRSLSQAGTLLAFGSDAPVEDPNPFWGLHAAVCRSPRQPAGAPAWTPEQRIPLQDALLAYTATPARIAGWAGKVGSLRPGSHADLIVLEEDLFEVPEEELFRVKPAGTLVAGEWLVRTF